MRPAFREARWRRAGATDEQLTDLAAAHADMSVEEQDAEGARIDSVSDVDLASELDVDSADLIAGTKDEILARVAGDVDLAAVALSHEQARARPRKGVVEALSALVAAHDDQDG